MAYRDDLEAAHIRIQQLEQALAQDERRIAALRAELVHRGRRHPWGWLAVGGVATLLLVGAGAGQVLYAQDHVADGNTRLLQHELHEAQADLAQAREDRRVAFEMMAHNYERQQKEASLAPDLRDEDTAGGFPRLSLAVPEPPERSRADRPTMAKSDDVPVTTGDLHVSSDRAARVAVDGSSVHGWTPVSIALAPGSHAINVIAADGESRTYNVRVWQGHNQRLVVRFD